MDTLTLPSGASPVQYSAAQGYHVPAGKCRNVGDARLIWGLIPLATKVATADTDGRMYIFQHRDMGKGGPPRHIHHAQDEWFLAIEGEYVIEIADRRYHLKPGDSVFAPRQIPHAWAHISDRPGTLLTIVSPAGTFEQFIMETTEHATLPSPADVAVAFARHNMTVVGPPLVVE